MDKDRQIRFLYPPLIFIASLLLGIYFDDSTKREEVPILKEFIASTSDNSAFIAFLGASSLVLLLGFLLGTITVLALRLSFWWNGFNYEIKLGETAFEAIGIRILKGDSKVIDKEDKMYAGIVFDHGCIPKNIHNWIIRRWNSFFIACSSIVALSLSLLIGSFLKIQLTSSWLGAVIFFIVLFLFQAYLSWRETMKMIEFMTKVAIQENGTTQN